MKDRGLFVGISGVNAAHVLQGAQSETKAPTQTLKKGQGSVEATG